MPRIRLHAVAVGLGLALMATTVSAELVTPNSQYRQIDNYGVGNCIWSAGHLYFEKEGDYAITTEFGTANPPKELRCYYPRRVMDMRTKGAFYNQIRDENEYYGYFTIEYSDGGATHYEELSSFHPDNDSVAWDQGRVVISGNKCEFDDDQRNDGCVDIDLVAIEMAQEKGASFPFTADLCYSRYYKWTDDYEEVWDDFRDAWVKNRTRVSPEYMAKSCVTFTTTGERASAAEGSKAETPTKKKKKKLAWPPPPIKLPF